VHFVNKPQKSQAILFCKTLTMKVVFAKQQTMTARADYLPLVPDKDLDAVPKENSIGFTLKTNPRDANSTTYKVNVRILVGGESPRVMIRWKLDLERVCEGLNAQTIGEKVRVTETLLRNMALTLFQSSILKQATDVYDAALAAAADAAARGVIQGRGVHHYRHLDHFGPAIQNVFNNMMPKKILQYVKRNLRRNCRKPKDVKVRIYFQHLSRINTEELPELPPFNDNQELSGDEIIDILLYGTPRSWAKEMDRQGFDPMDHTPAEVVDFMEQIETAEDFDGHVVEHNSKTTSNNNNKKSSNGNGNKDNGTSKSGKYCSLHGKGNHTTDDCRTIKSEVKKLKSTDTKTPNTGYAYKNKSWSKKAEDYKKKSQKELNAMGKVVEKLKKEVNALTKKRKPEDSDEEELHAIERQLDAIDMNGFDIEDLKKSMNQTDDEVSV
jgi:hypothetical protein